MPDVRSELVRVSAAGAEPLSVSDAKLWLRVDNDFDDALIFTLISAARRYAERFCRRSFILGEQWKLNLDHFPLALLREGEGFLNQPLSELWNTPEMYLLGRPGALAITIPMGPVSAIDAVTYTDPTGAAQTLSASAYTLVPDGDANAMLYPAYETGWPATQNYPQSVQVLFTAGATPEPDVLLAMKQLLSAFYQDRMPVANNSQTQAADRLLWPSRLLEF